MSFQSGLQIWWNEDVRRATQDKVDDFIEDLAYLNFPMHVELCPGVAVHLPLGINYHVIAYINNLAHANTVATVLQCLGRHICYC